MKWTNRQCWLQGLTASAEVSRCRPQFSSCWRASALLLTLSTNFFIVARRWLGVQRVWALRSYQHHTCPDENTQTHQSPIHTRNRTQWHVLKTKNCSISYVSQKILKIPKTNLKNFSQCCSWSLTCDLLIINLNKKITYSISLSTGLFVRCCFVVVVGLCKLYRFRTDSVSFSFTVT